GDGRAAEADAGRVPDGPGQRAGRPALDRRWRRGEGIAGRRPRRSTIGRAPIRGATPQQPEQTEQDDETPRDGQLHVLLLPTHAPTLPERRRHSTADLLGRPPPTG